MGAPRSAPARHERHAPVDRALLSCGVVAPLVYVGTDVLLARRWRGYSYRDQTISELNAICAPTRTLSIVLGVTGYAFLTAFGAGVRTAAARDRRLRIAGAALTAFGAFGCVGVPFLPMHVRGAERSLTDTLHVAQLGVAGPLLLLTIGFAAAATPSLRLYSAATILVTLAFGAWAGTYGADIANGVATPWAGAVERTSVYAYQLWLAVFALVLLAAASEEGDAGGA